MASRFAKRARTVISMHKRNITCVHAGEVLRQEKMKCCGMVNIFHCAEREHEVCHTKCRTCEHYKEAGV